MKIKITKSAVDALALPATGYAIYRDNELTGFGIRVTRDGAKTYIVERMVNGKNVRASVGRHGLITPTQARAMAAEMLWKMANGIDVTRPPVKPVQIIPTFGDLARAYIAERAGVAGGIKPRTISDYEKELRSNLAPWVARPAHEITRNDVVDLHRALSERGPTNANRAMRFARAAFNFGVDHEKYRTESGDALIQINPVGILAKRRLWNAARRRHTFLDAQSIGGWLGAVLALDPLRWGRARTEQVQAWLLLMACCGFRPGEAARFRTEDWDSRNQVLVIQDPKNANTAGVESFRFPLGWRMAQIVDALAVQGRAYLMESRKGPLADPRAMILDVREQGAHFSPHDLRRTFSSILSALQPAPSAYQIKRLLNHTPDRNDVTTDYIQHDTETLRAIAQRVEDAVFSAAASARPPRETGASNL